MSKRFGRWMSLIQDLQLQRSEFAMRQANLAVARLAESKSDSDSTSLTSAKESSNLH